MRRALWIQMLWGGAALTLAAWATPLWSQTHAPITLQWAGTQEVPAEELERLLAPQFADLRTGTLTAALADDIAFLAELQLRIKGFPDARVRYELVSGRRAIQLDVSEGPRAVVSDVVFAGNRTVSRDVLLEYFLGPTRENAPARVDALPFVETFLEDGQGLVERYYISEGYANVVVGPLTFQMEESSAERRAVDATLTVSEGPRFVVGTIRVAGGGGVPAAELGPLLNRMEGRPYSNIELVELESSVSSLFKSNGFYLVSVEASGSVTNAIAQRVPVDLAIESGPRFRMGGIEVTGARAVPERVVSRRFEPLQGTVFSPAALRKRHRELIQSGLFSEIRLDPQPRPNGILDLQIKVEEARPKRLAFSAGFDTLDGPLAAMRYQDRNLFRMGRPLEVAAQISARRMNGHIRFEDPWLFDTDMNASLGLAAESREEPGYSIFNVDVQGDVGFEPRPGHRASVFGRAGFASLSEVFLEPEVTGDQEYARAAIGLRYEIDTRDSDVLPTRGSYARVDLESGSVGPNYVKAEWELSYLQPLGDGVLAGSSRGGWMETLEADGIIPIDERFFLGGPNTIRSFEHRRAGPKSENYPIGGNAYMLFNVEYRHPIWKDLWGAAFLDAGTLQRDASDLGFRDFKYGVGLGLRYHLPIGALRLDYGINPDVDPSEGEEFGAFHFSVGLAF